MRFNLKRLGGILFLSTIYTVLYIVSEYNNTYSLIPIALAFVMLIIIYRVRENLPLILFWFFLFLFPFDFLLALYSGEKLLPVYKFEYLNDVFYSFSISTSILSAFMVESKTLLIGKKLALIKSDTILIVYLLIAFCFTLSIKGNVSLFSDNSYALYQGNLKQGNGIIEYVLMIFIAILFFKKSNKLLLACTLCMLFYIVKMFLLGFRVQTMVALLILFFMVRNKHPKPVVNIILCIASFSFMLFYGVLKEGVNILDEGIRFNALLDTRYGYIQSHQHGVLSSSTVILSHALPNDIPKILVLPSTFLASVVPRFLLDSYIPFVYPSAYVQNFEYTPGGGIFSTQIFYLTGSIGLLVLSFLIAFIFRIHLISKTANIFTVASITLICFFPRWISYDFFNFALRTTLIVIVLVYIPKILPFIKVNYVCNIQQK